LRLAALRLLIFFAANQPKFLSMNNLRSRLRCIQPGSIKPNQAKSSNLFNHHTKAIFCRASTNVKSSSVRDVGTVQFPSGRPGRGKALVTTGRAGSPCPPHDGSTTLLPPPEPVGGQGTATLCWRNPCLTRSVAGTGGKNGRDGEKPLQTPFRNLHQ
jgi:hypothetical protein